MKQRAKTPLSTPNIVERIMKWPIELVMIRHMKSAFNELWPRKQKSKLYQRFMTAYHKDYESAETRELALLVAEKFGLGVSDSKTPGTKVGMRQALKTGKNIHKVVLGPPDGVIISPYDRTDLTYGQISLGYPQLKEARWVKRDEKARELEHGLSLLYNDKYVFFALYPEQRRLYELMGKYRYQWPQGESVPDVRARAWMLIDSIIRNYAGLRVWIITHHLFILALMAEIEGWSEEEFIRMDKTNPPANCSVTIYRGFPEEGRQGRLKRHLYSKILY